MDMSDLFKRHFANLHKATQSTKTIEDRKIDLRNERKFKRDTLAFTKRNIDVNMSPYYTPVAPAATYRKMNKCERKNAASTSKKSDGVSKRLEMLAKWKVEKAKQKQQEQANKKPIFKVCHVNTECSVNLEDVNRLIKGRAILNSAIKKSQFAPDNYKFRPPMGIKPINFPTPLTKTKISENVKKATAKPIKVPTALRRLKFDTPKPKVQKPEKEINQSKNSKNTSGLHQTQSRRAPKTNHIATPSAPIVNKRNTNTRTAANQKKAATRRDEKIVSENNSKTKTSVNSAKKNNVLQENKSCLNTSVQKTNEDENIQLANEDCSKSKQITACISPFITVARGKRNARDEYEYKMQNSFSKGNLQPVIPDTVRSGADYFEFKLDSEIDRLTKLCEVWEICLQDSDLPEESRSSIDVAIGQSRLLIAKKFQQFRGLIMQCKTKQYEEKVITCQDLHGFWDMLYMQVEDLDKRFSSLEKLKKNNWIEILPAKKVPVKRTKTRAKKIDGSSRLKDMIQAARQKQKADKELILENEKVCAENNFAERIPLRERPLPQTPIISTNDQKNNLRLSKLTPKVSCSPGLTMMKITQSIKQGNGLTPAKGILKVDSCKSTGKKSVAFLDASSPKNLRKTILFVEETLDVKENVICNDKENERVVNCLRRSSRLAKYS